MFSSQNEDIDSESSNDPNCPQQPQTTTTSSSATPESTNPANLSHTPEENEPTQNIRLLQSTSIVNQDENITTTDSIPTTGPVDSPSENSLPTGWSIQLAPNGRIFYIDHNTRKTSWVDPRTGRASSMPNQDHKQTDDLGALPEGWEERVHLDGRIFFIDHGTFYFVESCFSC